MGKYRVVLGLGDESNKIELNQMMNLWIFPWKTVTILLVLAGIILILRRRIWVAAKVMFNIKYKKLNIKNINQK